MGQQNNKQICCNTTNQSVSKSFQDLVYYMTVDDNIFGRIPVYSSSKKPSSYVAKLQKQYPNSSVFNLFQKIENHQLTSLVSLHAFQVQRNKYLTGHMSQKITSYWEYYNYYFSDYIKMRSLRNIAFTERQIWFIIKTCSQSFSIFDQYNLILDLDIRKIVVIPQGKMKLYWHHIQSKNQHLKFYNKMHQLLSNKISLKKSQQNRPQFLSNQSAEFDSFYYSPQQFNGLQKRQSTINIDFARANSFRLGMIILYCLTFTDPKKTCYGKGNQIGRNRIKVMVLNSLYEDKVQNSNKYSQDLKHLIKLLLLEDPNKRIPITCLLNVYQKYMSQDSQLMMGITQNPFQIQSSSRNNLNEIDQKQPQIEDTKNHKQKNYTQQQFMRKQSRSNSRLMPEFSNRNSRRLIGSRQQQNIFIEEYDKFDTKTVKISSSYHKKQK